MNPTLREALPLCKILRRKFSSCEDWTRKSSSAANLFKIWAQPTCSKFLCSKRTLFNQTLQVTHLHRIYQKAKYQIHVTECDCQPILNKNKDLSSPCWLDEMPPLPERCNRPHFYIFPSSPLTQVSLFRFCQILLSNFSLAQTLLNCDLDQHSKGLLLRTYCLFWKSWDEAGTQLRSARQPLCGIRWSPPSSCCSPPSSTCSPQTTAAPSPSAAASRLRRQARTQPGLHQLTSPAKASSLAFFNIFICICVCFLHSCVLVLIVFVSAKGLHQLTSPAKA